MKKIPHILRENKKTELPEHIIFFDTETNQIKEENGDIVQNLRLGWACYQRRTRKQEVWKEFYDNKTFWDFVETFAVSRRKLYIVAHNIGFDMLIANAYYELPKRGYKLVTFYDENTTHITTWIIEKKDAEGNVILNKYGRPMREKTILCMDSMNYFKTSLAVLGEQMGFPKTSVDFETCTDEELSPYCKNDVGVLKKAMNRWFDFHQKADLGNFAFTIAGQSLNTFRHRFMPTEIYIHNNYDVYQLERASYFGGRTESFYIGYIDTPIYLVDVNSMYPSVMLEETYPTKLIGYCEDISLNKLVRTLEKYLVIAEVEVETDTPIFPVKHHDKLIFPIGKFTCTLATPELKEGLVRGMIRKVNKVSVYEHHNIFREYVDFFYTKRLQAKAEKDEVFTYFYKLLLNSLYGKFGQKIAGWEIVEYTDDLKPAKWTEYDEETGEHTSYRQFAGIIQKMKEGFTESLESFPAISSHVTSYARLKLFKCQEIAGRENVYYCDTDSIFCTETGFKRLEDAGLIDGKKLGLLGLDGIAPNGTIYGLKDYVMGDKAKTKGVKKKSEHLGKNEEGKEMFRQDQWKRLSGLIADGNIGEHRITKITKTLKREYDKGIITNTGRVLPYEF